VLTPAGQALADQLTADIAKRIRAMIRTIRAQRTEEGREQTSSNLALALSFPPFDDPEVRRAYLMVAIDLLADHLPDERDDLT
jgi:hypothetical protein